MSPSQQFVIIFGPPAVGKMTVAYAIAERTGFKVFHNHMTIELVLPFFAFGTPAFNRLVGEFRQRIFEEVAASDAPGLIFTYVWAFDAPGDRETVDAYCDLFAQHGWTIALVELLADQAERLKRNRSELRLAHKPSKRDLAWSEAHLLDLDRRYKLNSTDETFDRGRYLRLDTTQLSAEHTAERIIAALGLATIQPAADDRSG
jgi:hypothetical protein